MEMNPLEGLLGPQKMMDPTVMGLLSAAAAGMQASGPSRTPTSIGQTFGAALGAGMPAYMQTQQFNAQRQMQGLQTAKMLDDMAQTGQKRTAIRDYAMSLPEGERAQFLANPEGYLAAKAKAMEPFSLKPGEQRYNGNNVVAQVPEAFTLGPGQRRVSGGNVVASVPERPRTAEDSTGVLRYVDGENPGAVVPGFGTMKSPEGFTRNPDGSLKIDPGFLAGKSMIAGAGATRIQNNVNSFTPASEAAQKDFMDKTAKNFEALQSAPVAINNLRKARALTEQGNPFLGSFGDKKLEIVKFFNNNLGTSIAPESVANAGELKNRLFQQIMDNLKKMDSQPSQLQQTLMMDALGNVNSDPAALRKIMDVTEEILRGKVESHNKTVKDAESRGVKFPFNPVIDIQQSAAPTMTPPAPAISRLKMNKNVKGEREKFDEIFGAGAAARALGE